MVRVDSIKTSGIYISGRACKCTNVVIDWCGDNAVIIWSSDQNVVEFTSTRYAANYYGALNNDYVNGGAAILIHGTSQRNRITCVTNQGDLSDTGSGKYSPLCVVELDSGISNVNPNVIVCNQAIPSYNTANFNANYLKYMNCRGAEASPLRVEMESNIAAFYGDTAGEFKTASNWNVWPEVS